MNIPISERRLKFVLKKLDMIRIKLLWLRALFISEKKNLILRENVIEVCLKAKRNLKLIVFKNIFEAVGRLVLKTFSRKG